MPTPRNSPQKVLAKTVLNPKTGCRVWPTVQTSRSKSDPRAVMPKTSMGGNSVLVSHVLWKLAGKTIPKGDRLEKTCSTLCCVAVEHHRLMSERKRGEKSSMARKPSSVRMREAILFFVGAREDGLREPVLDLLVEGRKNNPGKGLVGGVEPTYREGRPTSRKPESYLKKKRRDMENAIAALEREGMIEVTEELRVRLRDQNGGRRK